MVTAAEDAQAGCLVIVAIVHLNTGTGSQVELIEDEMYVGVRVKLLDVPDAVSDVRAVVRWRGHAEIAHPVKQLVVAFTGQHLCMRCCCWKMHLGLGIPTCATTKNHTHQSERVASSDLSGAITT